MIIIINILILILILFILYKCIFYLKQYEPFENLNSEYPCRVFLSDKDFLTHMITHHQMAIDISYQHIHNTQNDIIMKVLRELIWTQEYEIGMMLHELHLFSFETPIINVFLTMLKNNIKIFSIYYISNNNENK
jgi:hypothetical protein